MTGPAVPVPGGDPQAVRSAAAQLGSLATAHSEQFQSFQGHVKTALTGWSSAVAGQYAVAAGQASSRFTMVSTTLKAAEAALNAYANALEDAQRTVGWVNGQFAQLSHEASSGPRWGGLAETEGSLLRRRVLLAD
jgi:hypothetical protein